ncbi:MAG: hypothetical protein ACHQIH_05140, partial [Ignavibacteria bacterium]
VIIVSEVGLKELKSQNIYGRLKKETVFIIDDSIRLEGTGLNVISLPLRKLCGADKACLGAVDYYVRKYKPFEHDAFRGVIEKKLGEYGKIFKSEYYDI